MPSRRAIQSAIVTTALLLQARAWGQQPPLPPYGIAWAVPPVAAPARETTRTDPLLPTGLALLTVAAAGSWAGVAAITSSETTTVCGMNGCVTADRPSDGQVRGWAVLGGAIGAGVVAVPAIVAGLGSAPPVDVRRSEGGLVAGTWLAGVGASLLGFAIAHAAAPSALGREGKVDGESAATAFGVLGGALVAVGTPLALRGAVKGPGPPAPRKLRSEARLYTGMALTTLGAAAVGAGAYTAAMFGDEGDLGGFAILPVSVPLLLAGCGLVGAGIPLWVGGTRSLPDEPEPPSLVVGPGSVSLEGRF